MLASDDPWCGTPCFDLAGVFDVQPGQIVTMSDGQTTKVVHVTSLVVTSVDATFETVSGTAEPHSEVWVDVHEVEGFSRHVTADGSGYWVADFSTPGDEDFEQNTYDLQPGSYGRAIQFEVEGWDDGTLAYWGIPTENHPPTIDAITAPVDPVAISDQPVSVEVTFSDPDDGDTHAVTWDWGDGNSDTQAGTTSPSSIQHTYAEPGVYSVQVTVTDAAGASDTAVYEFIVIYDPEGGFVTGGGWIWSPAGAYTADSTLEGKATFGFVSKYKKGAKVPDGQTQFQFRAGDLNFHSDSYDWLVVAGAKAMFKGVGTINGAGNYGFMLSAIDSALTPSTDVDLFRIKIWDRDNGDAIVYDNQMDASDDADPTTALGGGNIVVHKAK